MSSDTDKAETKMGIVTIIIEVFQPLFSQVLHSLSIITPSFSIQIQLGTARTGVGKSTLNAG